METLYFVDGYHGGIEGHMPEGSWQDIMEAMSKYPGWKISLEIEPESWEYLKMHDKRVYKRLKQFIEENEREGRIEFISGSYAQPFCWGINGESNIRQLLRGRALINAHFPKAVIDTYAVQEPCFTSSLPQILVKMGYTRFSLKNPTSWGGYMAKMPGDIVNLAGSGEYSIPAVVRYECEELYSCSATEASGYDGEAIKVFADKCVSNGINAPVGMCLQDLGWQSKPLLRNKNVKYVTWREYFDMFAKNVDKNVGLSQEHVLVALPWGNRILQEMLRNIRACENAVLRAEKLLALAESLPAPDTEMLPELKPSMIRMGEVRNKLGDAWDMLMRAQHHDAYICASTRDGYKNWAFRSNSLCYSAMKITEDIEHEVFEAVKLHDSDDLIPDNEVYLRVYSTVGSACKGIADARIGLPRGFNSVEVYDGDGNLVPSQLDAVRRYYDETVGAADLRFNASVNGVGYTVYKAVFSENAVQTVNPLVSIDGDNVNVENGVYSIVFDLAAGGAIKNFRDTVSGKEYVQEGTHIGYIEGFSIKDGEFIKNLNNRAECEVAVNGDLYAVLSFTGWFNGIGYRTIVTVRKDDRCVDFKTITFFHKDTEIGYPYAPPEKERYAGTKRSSCREDYKLGVRFGVEYTDVYKSAPFDIYKSGLNDTRFDSWTEIKHNIINGYMDFYDGASDTGLAVFCDHVNGYSLVDNDFSLTVAFGYHANFWWGYQPLRGKNEIGYSLFAHSGDLFQAGIPFEYSAYREPFAVERLDSVPEIWEESVFCVTGEHANQIEVVSIVDIYNGSACNGSNYDSSDAGGFAVRLFNNSLANIPLKYKCKLRGFTGLVSDFHGAVSGDAPDMISKLEILTLA